MSGRAAVPVRWGLVVVTSLAYLALGLVPALAIRVVSFEAFESAGPSMEPTLGDGDRFVLDKSAYGLTLPLAREQIVHWSDPAPGDVVVLRSPFDEIDIVKRVIGVAGDEIEIRDDVVLRNGEPLEVRVLGACPAGETGGEGLGCEQVEERIGARTWRTSREPAGMRIVESMPRARVPDGHVFVLGDHRDRSNDSRNPRLGMIPVDRLRGRATAIYWSDSAEKSLTWIE
jgi:signal peptidase I